MARIVSIEWNYAEGLNRPPVLCPVIMHPRYYLLCLVFPIFLTGPILGRAADKNADAASAAAEAAAQTKLAGLKLEMPADTVRQLMGTPDEVRPMKTPDGKAEVWAYTRVVNIRMERIEVPGSPIITTVVDYSGTAHQSQTPGPPSFRNVSRITEETTELLMFNGRYVTHKLSRHERRSFE